MTKEFQREKELNIKMSKMDKPITIRVNLIDENENPVCSPILESWSRETESYQ